ncbi:proton-coupled amino acid transporter-like protein CG1139 isoform X2 [Tenebrio molitor]|uniref:proton-coupled amino acid transporter-like protein CG1139 isoform X2 n=1 Tax=Tenebrio molitor TaxID=7067 RepID=UPI00362488A0
MMENRPPTDQGTTRPFLLVRGTDVTGHKKPTNYFETLVHAVKGYVGSGIFAMGLAYSSSGILLGPVMMLAIALMNLHCQHLLIRACIKITDKEPVEVLPSFAETVQYTFEDSKSQLLQKYSKRFGILTDVFLIVAEYGFCVVYFIFVSRHLGEISAAHGWDPGYRVILAIILIPMLLTTFLGSLKLLMPVSLIANVIMWVGIVLILYFSSLNLPPLSERDLISHVERLPLFFGIVLFAFEGITFIIPLRMEMKNPDSFTSRCGVLNMTMIIVISLYLLVGFLAYWQWGDEVQGSAFLNMPESEPLSQATKILISLGVMLTYALHMYIPFEIAYPRFYRKWGPSNHPTVIIYIYRTIAVLVTYGIANISSNLGMFISLVGALTGAVLAMLLPVLLELVMLYGDLTYFVIIKDVFIIVVAIAAAITGTILSIMDIVKDYTEESEEK